MRIEARLPPGAAAAIFELIVKGLEPKTASNYGAGILRFTQFCDQHGIPEAERIPAPEYLLAAFVARHAGTVQAGTIKGWLSGLQAFHAINGAAWQGDKMLKYAKKGAKKASPEGKPQRPPVTREHMEALVNGLDMSNTFDVAVFAASCAAFWGCRRLGEIVIPTPGGFDPEKHVSRGVAIGYRETRNGTRYAIFHIPWTKTTGKAGADVVLTGMSGFLDPITALQHHIATNAAVPSTAPLFSFETADGWSPMTRDWLIKRCNEVWQTAGLELLSGHCFRIGGATEHLLRGVHPDVVATLGSWQSRAFLLYWRRIETIIPQFISEAADGLRVQAMRASMDTFSRRMGLSNTNT